MIQKFRDDELEHYETGKHYDGESVGSSFYTLNFLHFLNFVDTK